MPSLRNSSCISKVKCEVLLVNKVLLSLGLMGKVGQSLAYLRSPKVISKIRKQKHFDLEALQTGFSFNLLVGIDSLSCFVFDTAKAERIRRSCCPTAESQPLRFGVFSECGGKIKSAS